MDRSRSGMVYHQCSSRMLNLAQFHDQADSARQPLPARRLFLQLFSAQSCQGVEFCSSAELTGFPFGRDPAFLLQLVQRGIERAIADLQYLAGDLRQALTDSPTVQRLQRQNLEKQEVQGTLDQIRWFAHSLSPRLPRISVHDYVLGKQEHVVCALGQTLPRFISPIR